MVKQLTYSNLHWMDRAGITMRVRTKRKLHNKVEITLKVHTLKKFIDKYMTILLLIILR